MKQIFYKSNQITYFRILLIPVFGLIFVSSLPYREYIAAFIFIMLSLSDGLDGYVARKRNEVSSLGKIIDPVADKLLIGTALIFLVVKQQIDAWMAIVILGREIIITGIRLIAFSKGIVISASRLGKVKTVSQIVGILMVMLDLPYAYWAMAVAVGLTIISGISYLINAARMVEEKIVNVPNLITAARLFLIPFYMALLFKNEIEIALLLFIVIGISDKLDGLFARMTKQKTNFGKVFDSFTDWCLIIGSFLSFYLTGMLAPYWLILMSVPSAANGIVKLLYMKMGREVVLTHVAQAAVAFTYLTVGIVLFKFEYKELFLIAMIILIYTAMIRYIIQAVKDYKTESRIKKVFGTDGARKDKSRPH